MSQHSESDHDTATVDEIGIEVPNLGTLNPASSGTPQTPSERSHSLHPTTRTPTSSSLFTNSPIALRRPSLSPSLNTTTTSSCGSGSDQATTTKSSFLGSFCSCCLIRLWSVTSLSICVLLSVTVLTALVFWSVGYIFSYVGLKSLGSKAQTLRLLQVRDRFDSMLVAAPVALNLLEMAFLFEEGVNDTRLWNLTSQEEEENYDLVNLLPLRRIFFRVGKALSAGVDLLMYGTEHNGGFYALGLVSETLSELTGVNLTLHVSHMDPNDASFLYVVPYTPPYDSRVRPWYVAGKRSPKGNMSWSSTFLDVGPTPLLGIDLAKPFYTPEEEKFVGVLSAHQYLNGMSEYLQNADLEEGEVMYVVSRADGMMIASSVGVVGKRLDDSSPWEKITAVEHTNSVVRMTSIKLNELFPSSSSDAGVAWKSTTEGDSSSFLQMTDPATSIRYLVDVLEYSDPYGLEAVLVTANPRTNVFGESDKAQYISLGLSGGLFVFSLVVALAFAYMLSQPLRQISAGMRRIANLDFDQRGISCTNTLRLYEYGKMNRDMTKMSQGLDSFARFLPRDVVVALVGSGHGLSLQMRREDITVFFVDIQNFTTISESASPERLLRFLCEFFELATRAIADHGGTLDKLIGDCVMAFWNAPRHVKDHPLKAVEAATVIVHETEFRNTQTEDDSRIPFTVRCGINTGEALVGLIGSQEKVSYTVLGDVVNVASRLEFLNKRYSSKILIGPQTASSCSREFACQYVDTVVLKGKSVSLPVYSVIGKTTKVSAEQLRDCRHFDTIRELFDKDEFGLLERELLHENSPFETEEGRVAAKLLLERIGEMDQKGRKGLRLSTLVQ